MLHGLEQIEGLGLVFPQRIALGLASGGRLVEVFSTEDGSTWTLLLTAPDGTSCMMAEGQGWSALPGPIVGQVS